MEYKHSSMYDSSESDESDNENEYVKKKHIWSLLEQINRIMSIRPTKDTCQEIYDEAIGILIMRFLSFFLYQKKTGRQVKDRHNLTLHRYLSIFSSDISNFLLNQVNLASEKENNNHSVCDIEKLLQYRSGFEFIRQEYSTFTKKHVDLKITKFFSDLSTQHSENFVEAIKLIPDFIPASIHWWWTVKEK